MIVFGVIAVLTGVTASVPFLVWAGALSVVAGLVILGVSIAQTVRRSLLKRFDLSAQFYLLACGAGVVGVSLGAFLGTGTSGSEFQAHRLVHSHLNLVGLVGFSIIGTVPTFLPTVAHNRAVSGREAIVGWWLCIAAAAFMVAGLISQAELVGAGTILTGIAGLLVLVGIEVRLWSQGRHQVPFLQVSAGTVWLIVWAFVDGTRLVLGQPAVPFEAWTAAAVLAGVGQVLAGSLAYLIPVLIGTPLAGNVNRMKHRPVFPLFAANLTGLALVIGWEPGAVIFGAAWVIDLASRLARTVGSARPGPDDSADTQD
jgi:nitrite reductase (NO-forming)